MYVIVPTDSFIIINVGHDHGQTTSTGMQKNQAAGRKLRSRQSARRTCLEYAVATQASVHEFVWRVLSSQQHHSQAPHLGVASEAQLLLHNPQAAKHCAATFAPVAAACSELHAVFHICVVSAGDAFLLVAGRGTRVGVCEVPLGSVFGCCRCGASERACSLQVSS